MQLTDALTVSTGALVIRKVGNRAVLFVQKPGLLKTQIVAAVISMDSLPALADFIINPPVGEWNRFDATVATAADLTGT
jgi:hypothetical protein